MGVVGRTARGPRTGRSRDRWKNDNIKQGFGPSDLKGGPDPSQVTDTCHVPISWFVGPHFVGSDGNSHFWIFILDSFGCCRYRFEIFSSKFLTQIYGKFLYLEFLA